MEKEAHIKKKLKQFKVLVPVNRKYKDPIEKKIAKLERQYEKTPEECVLKRQKIMKQVEKLL